MKLGIQLYSVRDQLSKDFPGTLRAIKAMGFEGVEIAFDYGGLSPEGLAALLEEQDLACCGMHLALKDLLDAQSEAYRYARALRSPYVTTSCAGKQYIAAWDETIRAVADAGRVAAAQGFQFTYHNHAPEMALRDGGTLLDALYAATDPRQVQAELDTAWIHAGDQDPLATLAQYAGRIPQVHAKDYSRTERQLKEIGRGDLDFRALVETARKGGAEWIIYELDASTLGDSLQSARESAAALAPLVR